MLQYTNDTPTESGYYLWKNTLEAENPCQILAKVKTINNKVYVNFTLDIQQFEFYLISSVVAKFWSRVS